MGICRITWWYATNSNQRKQKSDLFPNLKKIRIYVSIILDFSRNKYFTYTISIAVIYLYLHLSLTIIQLISLSHIYNYFPHIFWAYNVQDFSNYWYCFKCFSHESRLLNLSQEINHLCLSNSNYPDNARII